MKYAKIIAMLLMIMVSTTSYAARSSSSVRSSSNDDYDYDLKATGKFHIGLGLGSMRTDIPTVSGRSVAWSLFAGTEINRFLSAEVGYTSLGSTDLGGNSYMKGSAYSVNVVGNIPVTKAVSMFAKFGLANTGVFVETAGVAGTTYSTVGPTIGLGVRAGISKKTDVRIAYDNYKFSADNVTTNNAEIISAALIYKF